MIDNSQKPSAYSSLRYFKGEKECPKSLAKAGKEKFWFYEKCWIDWNGEYDGSNEYEAYGLSAFETEDGVPASLKRLLFNRYMHWAGGSVQDSIQAFKKWYIEEYKNL